MMQLDEIAALRTRLRDVNIAYSALVRAKAGGDRFVRMDDLRTRRHALMALIDEAKRRPQRRVFSGTGPLDAAGQAA